MSAMTARVSAYSCLRTVAVISDRLGGRLVLKLLFTATRLEDDLGGSADAIFSRPCGQSGR